jgi:hypothetical protein
MSPGILSRSTVIPTVHQWESEMRTSEVRELSPAELQQVAGGVDGSGNWKGCINGPAGSGVYPWYVKCDYTNAEFVRDIINNGKGGGKA